MASTIDEKFDLTKIDKQLLLSREEEHNGSWDLFLVFLQNRINRKPYVHHIATDAAEDRKRIIKMQQYEQKYGVNLYPFEED